MRLYGLLGRKLGHSFSKTYFDQRFLEEGISDAAFENFELESIVDLKKILNERPEFKGATITIPYKEEVLEYATSQSEAVQQIGAANVISIEGDNIIAHNTDYIGFWESIKPFNIINKQQAMILGTGGAAKAVKYALESNGISCLLVSRNANKGDLVYGEIDKYISQCQMFVNASPVGMGTDHNAPQFPYSLLHAEDLVCDLIYTTPLANGTRTLTPFLTSAERSGAKLLDGLDMLQKQADAAWDIWNIS